jgi:hypothetical protein
MLTFNLAVRARSIVAFIFIECSIAFRHWPGVGHDSIPTVYLGTCAGIPLLSR